MARREPRFGQLDRLADYEDWSYKAGAKYGKARFMKRPGKNVSKELALDDVYPSGAPKQEDES